MAGRGRVRPRRRTSLGGGPDRETPIRRMKGRLTPDCRPNPGGFEVLGSPAKIGAIPVTAKLLALLGAVTGLGYGAVLAFLGLVATGAGHGSYVLIGLCSSPLGLTQSIPLALFGTPVFWAIVGALFGGMR